MKTKQQKLTPFGKKVRKRLIDKGMTQVELAALLGCNKQYIHKILVGERSGKKYIEEIEDLQELLGIGRTRAYELVKEAYKTQQPFKVIKLGKLYRIPKKPFDDWLEGNT